MNPRDRLPDFRSPEFWKWAIEHKAANPSILSKWFPETTRASWTYRCEWAKHNLGVTIMKAKRNTFEGYPADPPDGWPERAEDVGGIDPDKARPQAEPRLPAAEVERFADGSCKSTRVVPLSTDDLACPDSVLIAHGFDPAKWELVSMRNKEYQGFHKIVDGFVQHPSGDVTKAVAQAGHRVVTMYASSITVKPRTPQWSIEDMVSALTSAVTPVKVTGPNKGSCCFEVALTDTHLGNSTLEWFKDNLARTIERINRQEWAEVVIWIGSDFFHTDNFKNTTSNGTPQSSMWWPSAYKDGMELVGTIIEAALSQAVRVYAYYIPGNHDESMAWAFTQTVKERYPDVVFDDDIRERKVHVFEDCAIGMTHGDEKVRRDLDRVFNAEFHEFSSAYHREVHMGHLHHEQSIDHFGIMKRSMPTAARTDKYHRTEGYVGNNKRFQVFEWEAGRGVTDVGYV